MKVIYEKGNESRDFGDRPTLRVTAYDTSHAFRLGCLFVEIMEDKDSEVVQGTTEDKRGRFIRIPINSTKQ